MNVLITGGIGLLGSRLASLLLQRGTLDNGSGRQEVLDQVTLLDISEPQRNHDSRVKVVTGDIGDPELLEEVITPRTQAIFHLAAIVSSHAEADFDLGMKINFDATRMILERARKNGNCPRVVFSSSVAVFGGKLLAKVSDDHTPRPQSSYGTQKVMGELLVSDYSRKGFIDGRVLRMPTVVIRPGTPNKAASSFASGIIREPLNGNGSNCPVPPDTRMWLTSMKCAIDDLVHGHEIDRGSIAANRIINLPGLSITVAEMVAALENVAGKKTVDLIQWQPDPVIMKIVNTWPGDFDTYYANMLGFVPVEPFEQIIEAYRDEFVKQ